MSGKIVQKTQPCEELVRFRHLHAQPPSALPHDNSLPSSALLDRASSLPIILLSGLPVALPIGSDCAAANSGLPRHRSATCFTRKPPPRARRLTNGRGRSCSGRCVETICQEKKAYLTCSGEGSIVLQTTTSASLDSSTSTTLLGTK